MRKNREWWDADGWAMLDTFMVWLFFLVFLGLLWVLV